MWEAAYVDYRSMMKEKDTEDVQEILVVLEAKKREEEKQERETRILTDTESRIVEEADMD